MQDRTNSRSQIRDPDGVDVPNYVPFPDYCFVQQHENLSSTLAKRSLESFNLNDQREGGGGENDYDAKVPNTCSSIAKVPSFKRKKYTDTNDLLDTSALRSSNQSNQQTPHLFNVDVKQFGISDPRRFDFRDPSTIPLKWLFLKKPLLQSNTSTRLPSISGGLTINPKQGYSIEEMCSKFLHTPSPTFVGISSLQQKVTSSQITTIRFLTNIEQGQEAFVNARLGCYGFSTGSSSMGDVFGLGFHRMSTGSKMLNLLCPDSMMVPESKYLTKPMQLGVEYEPCIARVYELLSENTLVNPGIIKIRSPHLPEHVQWEAMNCTPDGVILSEHVIQECKQSCLQLEKIYENLALDRFEQQEDPLEQIFNLKRFCCPPSKLDDLIDKLFAKATTDLKEYNFLNKTFQTNSSTSSESNQSTLTKERFIGLLNEHFSEKLFRNPDVIMAAEFKFCNRPRTRETIPHSHIIQCQWHSFAISDWNFADLICSEVNLSPDQDRWMEREVFKPVDYLACCFERNQVESLDEWHLCDLDLLSHPDDICTSYWENHNEPIPSSPLCSETKQQLVSLKHILYCRIHPNVELIRALIRGCENFFTHLYRADPVENGFQDENVLRLLSNVKIDILYEGDALSAGICPFIYHRLYSKHLDNQTPLYGFGSCEPLYC